ncbi:MAG: ABC transporter permease [Arenicellales bacterium]|nr:ABC transporter permease [Arenicellales bacterium]
MRARSRTPSDPASESKFTPSFVIGLVIVSFWLLVALFGPALAPHLESDIVTDMSYAPAGEVGLLGSDYLGRDVFSRMLYGARMTMGLALLATLLSFSIGVILGFTAAISDRWVDGFMSRINDSLMAFPSVILALIVMSALGTSLVIMIVTVAIIDSTRVFRLSRALAMDISVMDFVDVARSRGESLWWITTREILPNTLAPLTAEFGIRFTFAILFISALSFLGLGVQPPAADWGVMVKENLQGLLFGSAAALMPACAVASLTVGVNLIVDWFLTRMGSDVAQELMN